MLPEMPHVNSSRAMADNRDTKRVWPLPHMYSIRSFASELIYQTAQSILLCHSVQV